MGRKLRNILTEEGKQFIRDNHEELTVVEMAKRKEVGVHPRTVYRFMDESGLSSKDGTIKKITIRKKKVTI